MPATSQQLLEKVQRAKLRIHCPIELTELERFEARAGVRLPTDYREFLLTCANGGMEPCRLVPLKNWNHCYANAVGPQSAGEACVITPEAARHGEAWLEKVGVPDWEARWDAGSWDPMCGTIAIAEIGCGLFYSLILSGPFRGRVFSWGDHVSIPPHFVDHADFASWIEACLDESLAGRPVHFLDGRLR